MYTDKNIPIKCAECDIEVEGIEAMEDHLLSQHVNISQQEAANFARHWADAAYDEIEQQLAAYYDDQKYERGLNRLRGKP